jgi:hypothetical protein
MLSRWVTRGVARGVRALLGRAWGTDRLTIAQRLHSITGHPATAVVRIPHGATVRAGAGAVPRPGTLPVRPGSEEVNMKSSTAVRALLLGATFAAMLAVGLPVLAAANDSATAEPSQPATTEPVEPGPTDP